MNYNCIGRLTSGFIMVKSNKTVNEFDEELLFSPEILLGVLKLSPDAIVLTRASDGRFIECNEMFLNQIGYSRKEVIGHTSLELNLYSFEERRAYIEAIWDNENLYDYETRIKRKDDTFLYILNSARFITLNGEKIILNIGKDITKRKEAEKQIEFEKERLKTILETTPSAVILVETDGEISYINKRAKQIYGFDITGLDLTTALSIVKSKRMDGSEYPIGVSPSGRALKGQLVRNEEMVLEQPDGTVIPILGSAAPIFNLDSKVTAAVAIFEDITELKKAEERKQELLESERQLTEELKTANEELINVQDELRDAISNLEVSNRELEEFAYVASHDLQEPLRMVSSFTQLLEKRYKDQLDRDAHDYIGFIVGSSQRMKDLIDDLLAFSRLNTEAKEFESTDLENALDDVLFNLEIVIEENNAKITHESLPITKCDSSQIRQLFQNLISNAIKFHSDKPPEIHISAKDSGKEWLFSVSDNGIGIDPEHQKKIFDVFRRLHTREEFEGTGIGLAICKRVVERHDGQIWVESELDKGSTFYFTIPKTVNEHF